MKQIKILKIASVLFVTAFLMCSCKKEVQVDSEKVKKAEELKQNYSSNCPEYMFKNKAENLNISILLDLSDRIDNKKYPNSTMQYSERDLGYINTIISSFLNHIKKKKLILMNDKIQVYFEPEPEDNSINEKSKKLKTFFTKDLTKDLIEKTRNNYQSIPKNIYDLARKDNKYIGSDTWRFFKDKVSRYCIEKCNRNILIVLTDGYMYHDNTKLKESNLTSYVTPNLFRKMGLNNSNWKNILEKKQLGFIPATNKLNDLEVLVLGIVNHDNKRNPYGKDVLIKFWSDWFDKMEVKKYEIYGADLPSNMEQTISNFILKN